MAIQARAKLVQAILGCDVCRARAASSLQNVGLELVKHLATVQAEGGKQRKTCAVLGLVVQTLHHLIRVVFGLTSVELEARINKADAGATHMTRTVALKHNDISARKDSSVSRKLAGQRATHDDNLGLNGFLTIVHSNDRRLAKPVTVVL